MLDLRHTEKIYCLLGPKVRQAQRVPEARLFAAAIERLRISRTTCVTSKLRYGLRRRCCFAASPRLFGFDREDRRSLLNDRVRELQIHRAPFDVARFHLHDIATNAGKDGSWPQSSSYVDSKHHHQCEQSNTDGRQCHGCVGAIGEQILCSVLFNGLVINDHDRAGDRLCCRTVLSKLTVM